VRPGAVAGIRPSWLCKPSPVVPLEENAAGEEVGEVAAHPLEVLRRRRSSKWLESPPDALPLTVAEMDFELAPAIVGVLEEALAHGDTGYATAASGLGQAFADFATRRWSWSVDPDSVTAVPDVASGVVEVLRVLTRPGDAVVVNTPVYRPFFDWVPAVGAELLDVPLAEDGSGWRLDLPALEAAFASGPAAFLLCNPHNPVGRCHRAEELAQVVALSARYEVPVVSDEIHAPLVLPGDTFVPMLTLPGAAERTITVLSASKAWNLAGLKCAMTVTGAPAMAAIVERIAPNARWHAGEFGVLAAIAAFTKGEGWLDRLIRTLASRRAELQALLEARLPMVRWHPPEATYLAWLDCRAIGSGSVPCERFLERGRVALLPGPIFGPSGSGYVRLNFATSAELLERAVDGMARSL
jgi:cysteine-S-conjugate beta-lyase